MATGPENRRIQAVSKLLHQSVYREKMHNPYRGGTPDMWYSGPRGDLWVEWKWTPKLPSNDATLVVPNLSELQKKWLLGREIERRNVYVVLGHKDGNVVMSIGAAVGGMSAGFCRAHSISNRATAHWIESICT